MHDILQEMYIAQALPPCSPVTFMNSLTAFTRAPRGGARGGVCQSDQSSMQLLLSTHVMVS